MAYFLIDTKIRKYELMKLAKITARGQTTIPKTIRDAAHLEPGDLLAFEIDGDHLVVRKIAAVGDEYLRAVSDNMTEWSSPEDEEAWRDL